MRWKLILLVLLLPGCAAPAPTAIPTEWRASGFEMVALEGWSYHSGGHGVWASQEFMGVGPDLSDPPTSCRAYRGNLSYHQDSCQVYRRGQADFDTVRSLDHFNGTWGIRAEWAGFQGMDTKGAGLPIDQPWRIVAFNGQNEPVFSWDGQFRHGAMNATE
jgi:hypothetical protein